MRPRLALATLLLCLAGPRAWAEDVGAPARDAPALSEPQPSPIAAEPAPSLAPTCLPERRIPIDPAAGPLHVGLKTYPQTLQLHDREVVLTFDDGPGRDTTPAVLAALKAACVHATFFLIGRNAMAHPQLARLEELEGHTVGHHSQTHPAFTLRGFDTASAERDIAAGIASDERAIYGAAATPEHPHVPFFRFPGFADTPALLAYLDQRKIAVFGTDLWAADWLEMTPEQERARVLALLEKAPHHNGIVLFHDTKASTARMLPALLAALRAQHYTIAHLVYDAAAKAPELTPPEKGWSSQTERIIAHLSRPIVPGAHHEGEAKASAPDEDVGEPPGAEPRP